MKRQRLQYDSYSTPLGLAHAITARLATLIPEPALVVEPSAGTGPFIVAARQQWPHAAIHAVDFDRRVERKCRVAGADAVYSMDWIDYAAKFEPDDAPVLVLGNVPYLHAQEHIEAALSYLAWAGGGRRALRSAKGHLALLLRLGFLAGKHRAATLWAQRDLRYVAAVAPRPSFAFRGTENSEYGLFVWQRPGHGDATLLAPITWET